MKSGKLGTKNKNLLIGVIILGLMVLFGISYPLIGYFLYPNTLNESQVIKIGHIGPLTGFAASYGEQERQGIDIAVEEINANGGVKGKKLIVIHEDDQLDTTIATNALNKLITVDKAPAVIGEISSSTTLALAPIAERNKVVLIAHVSNSDKISSSGDYIFRIYPTNALEAKKLVEIASSLNLTDCAIIYINNDFGAELAQRINNEFTWTGSAILVSEGYNPDATDFRTQLTKIKEKSPQAIFLIGLPQESGIILKQARELGIKSRFIASDTFNDPKIIEVAGNASEGVIFPYPSNGDPARFKQFSGKIKSKYGDDIAVTIVTSMAYDATNVLAAAMENGFTGNEIKAGLYEIKDYPGVTGNITFDKNGDVISRLFILKIVRNGKFEEYR